MIDPAFRARLYAAGVLGGFVEGLYTWTGGDRVALGWHLLPHLPATKSDPKTEEQRALVLAQHTTRAPLAALEIFGEPRHVAELRAALIPPTHWGDEAIPYQAGKVFERLRLFRPYDDPRDIGGMISAAFWATTHFELCGALRDLHPAYNAANAGGQAFAHWGRLVGEPAWEAASLALQAARAAHPDGEEVTCG